MVVAVGSVFVIASVGDADLRRNAEFVETQPREEATFVEVVPARRHGELYYVQFRGVETEVDYGWLIPDATPGAIVEVVQDPEDPDHIVAAGVPEDWAVNPSAPFAMTVLALTGGLIAAAIAGVIFVPELTEPMLTKGVDSIVRFVRWLRRTR